MIKKTSLSLLFVLPLIIDGISAQNLKKRGNDSFNDQMGQSSADTQKNTQNFAPEGDAGQIQRDVDQQNSGDNKKM